MKFLFYIFAICLFLAPSIVLADPCTDQGGSGCAIIFTCPSGQEEIQLNYPGCPGQSICCKAIQQSALCSSVGGMCKDNCGGGNETPNTTARGGCTATQMCCVPTSATENKSNPAGGPSAPSFDFNTIKTDAVSLNPFDISGPADLFSMAINLMMAFIGSIAILLYIYGGFLWMSSAGNSDQIGRAKTILIWTTLGAIAMGASYMIVKTVLTKIG